MIGRLIKRRYRILSKIGGGGMGTVWLARDETLGRRVALKALATHPTGEPMSVRRDRLIREARAAALVKHPGIVEIHDVFLDGDLPWIVMAYVEGASLQEMIDSGRPPPVRRIAAIARRVLAALRAAHEAKVVHRDVKPANILIERDDTAVLVDFGIAHIAGEARLTSTGSLPGTPDYMAPERICGREPGPAADLWSLGVTLFHTLEGYSPFLRSNPAATMYAIVNDATPPLRRAGPLASAIAALLEKDPDRRLTAAALDALLSPLTELSPTGPDGENHRRTSAVRPTLRVSREEHGRPATAPRSHRTGNIPPSRSAEEHGPPAAKSVPRSRETARRGTEGLTAQVVGRMPVTEARDALRDMEPEAAGGILLELAVAKAVSIIDGLPPRVAAAMLDVLAARPYDTVAVLSTLTPPRLAQLLPHMTPARAGALLRVIPPGKVAALLADTAPRVVAVIVHSLGVTPFTLRLIEAMSLRRAGEVLRHLPPDTIAALCKASTDGRADRLLNGLPEPIRTQALGYLR